MLWKWTQKDLLHKFITIDPKELVKLFMMARVRKTIFVLRDTIKWYILTVKRKMWIHSDSVLSLGTQWQGVGDYMIPIRWLYIKWALVIILYFAFVGVDTPRDPPEEKPHFTSYVLVGPDIAFLHVSFVKEARLGYSGMRIRNYSLSKLRDLSTHLKI